MPKKMKMTSPKGTAVWPWLNEPDTRWDDVGAYTVTLKMSAQDAEPFLTKLKEFYKHGYEEFVKEKGKNKLKNANMPWFNIEDDQGNDTGEIGFKFKNKASYEYEGKKIETRVQLSDTHGDPVTSTVGGGSTIKVGLEPYVWYVPSQGVGMTLRVKVVQVLNLVEYGGKSAADEFEFEIEEASVPTSTASESAPRGDEDFNF